MVAKVGYDGRTGKVTVNSRSPGAEELCKQGSPQGINALAQTTDGYLWIGTSSGLYRFDGLRFLSFVAFSLGPQFRSLDIVALAADAHNGLWMGFPVEGVSYLRAGRLTNYDEGAGLV